MKKIFLMAFFAVIGFTAVQAQCTKSAAACCSKSKGSTSMTSVTKSEVGKFMTVADKVAVNEGIERRQCPETGAVSYMRKSVCSESGTVSFTSVNFDEAAGKFVNVAPSSTVASAKVTTVNNVAAKKKGACCEGKKACVTQ
jgi:hypothetical protein